MISARNRQAVPRMRRYSRQALARLAHARVARELSEDAAALVPTRYDDPVELIERSAHAAFVASELVEAAVVHARAAGLSWERIGDVFEVSRQSVNEKYGPAEARWRLALLYPWGPDDDGRSLSVPTGLIDPEATAHSLDYWVNGHRAANGEPDADDTHPVSGHLPALGTAELLNMTLAEINDAITRGLRGADLADVHDRKAVAYDLIATWHRDHGDPHVGAEAAEHAEAARARARELRAIATTGTEATS